MTTAPRLRSLSVVATVLTIAVLPACSQDNITRSTVTVPSGLEQPSGNLSELLLSPADFGPGAKEIRASKKLADQVFSTMNSIKVEPKECNENDWTAQLKDADKLPQIVVRIPKSDAGQLVAYNIAIPTPEHHTTLRNQVTKCSKITMIAGTQRATTTFEEIDLGMSGDIETFATRSVTTGFDGAKETAFEAHVNVRHRALYYRLAGTDDEQLFRKIVERGIEKAAKVR